MSVGRGVSNVDQPSDEHFSDAFGHVIVMFKARGKRGKRRNHVNKFLKIIFG